MIKLYPPAYMQTRYVAFVLSISLFLSFFCHTLPGQSLKGKNIYSINYDFISKEQSEGMRPFQFQKKMGYLDQQMNIAIVPIYKHVYPFHSNRARVTFRDGGKYGFINKSGKLVIDTLYDDTNDFKDAKAVVSFQKKYGVIDTLGKVKLDFKYDYIYEFIDPGKTFAKRNQKFGILSITGEELSPFVFDDMGVVMENRAPVKDGKTNLWGVIDERGNLVIPYEYKRVGTCSEDRISVNKDGKMGFMDRQGKLVIALQYDNLMAHFTHGVAPVRINEKYGLINKNNEIIAPFIYDEMGWYFEKGLLFARRNGKVYYLNAQGKEQ